MKRILAAALFALSVAPAHAVNFPVNAPADAVDAAPGNGICATSGGVCTLRAAVMEANALFGADVIEVPAGVYTLAIAGADEQAAATGDLDVTGALRIEGAGAGVSVVDAAGLDRLFDVPASASLLAVQLQDLTLRGGRVANAAGGGIRHDDDGTLRLERVELTDHRVLDPVTSANIGGAVASIGSGTLEIEASVITDSAADRGGALFANGSLDLTDSLLEGNEARTGSAIASYADATIERTAIVSNVASSGYAIFHADRTAVLRNSTVSDNAGAGAISVGTGATLTTEHVTVFDNPVSTGVLAFGLVAFSNTAIANFDASAECEGSGTVISTGFNLDSDGTCVGSGDGDLPNEDPLLGPLADNGGPTPTHMPLASSPLLDAGDPSACPSVDQRGAPRPVDGDGDSIAVCDIGAVERAPEAGALANAAASLLGVRLLAARGCRSRRRS